MSRLWQKIIAKPFRTTQAEVPWFGPVVSAVLVAMLVQLALEALASWGGLALEAAGVGVLALVTVLFVFVYYARRRRRRIPIGPIADLPNPRKYRGLIFLFSNEATLRKAIEYHKPEYCWLVVTPDMEKRADEAATRIGGEYPQTRFDPVPIPNLYDTRACYHAVRSIHERDAQRVGIDPQDIIADITGGTKPMTMGMILACIEGDFAIEHVPTEFDKADGKPLGPLPPIQIAVRQAESAAGPG